MAWVDNQRRFLARTSSIPRQTTSASLDWLSGETLTTSEAQYLSPAPLKSPASHSAVKSRATEATSGKVGESSFSMREKPWVVNPQKTGKVEPCCKESFSGQHGRPCDYLIMISRIMYSP